ncbi:MAG TPA: hypothetical protein VFL83_14445 [Anaeromyxobacter sp.]|nr:hypothetical protein [Anaeromyxobacter sp.]
MPRTVRIALAAVAALVASAGPARAEPPCQADAKRFCGGKAPAELLSCLQAHRPDLAPACVARVEKVLVFFQSAATSCEPDAFEFCRGIGPGMPMVDCLRARDGKLTPMCQQFLDAARARDVSVQRACRDELARACPGAVSGRGEVWMCLGLGAVEVSEGCAAAL